MGSLFDIYSTFLTHTPYTDEHPLATSLYYNGQVNKQTDPNRTVPHQAKPNHLKLDMNPLFSYFPWKSAKDGGGTICYSFLNAFCCGPLLRLLLRPGIAFVIRSFAKKVYRL